MNIYFVILAALGLESFTLVDGQPRFVYIALSHSVSSIVVTGAMVATIIFTYCYSERFAMMFCSSSFDEGFFLFFFKQHVGSEGSALELDWLCGTLLDRKELVSCFSRSKQINRPLPLISCLSFFTINTMSRLISIFKLLERTLLRRE